MGGPSEKPLPIGVRYLVCYEFLFRFSVKGTQVVLVLFLFEHFRLSENLSAELVHIFLFIINIAPVLGAVLSDGYLGAYQTLLYCGLVQLGSMVILVLGAVPSAETGWRVIMISVTALGLLQIGVAVGGGKPVVTAFGGDQIEVLIPKGADRDRLRALFFSLFYLSLNAGSFLASMVIPPFRSIGSSRSYALIFSVDTAVLAVCILVFWLGRRHYAHRMVSKNTCMEVGKIIVDALRTRINIKNVPETTATGDVTVNGEREHLLSEAGEIVGNNGQQDITPTGDGKDDHWLDGAKLKHDATSVEDVKLLFRVLTLFAAVPVFWALFEQQYTKWIFQARSMNLEVSWLGGLVLQPEQIQGLNPVLVLIIIPILDQGIYPLCAKLNIPLPPLRKMVIGIGSAVVAFLASGVLQLAMDRSLKITSTPARLSVFWQVPQYFFITLGEVLINITGLEFAYSQAPSSMKSVLQGAWNVTAAIGNLMTGVIIALVGDRLSKANEFFLFAGGCAAAMCLMIWISHGYDDSQSVVPAHPDPVHAETTFVATNE